MWSAAFSDNAEIAATRTRKNSYLLSTPASALVRNPSDISEVESPPIKSLERRQTSEPLTDYDDDDSDDSSSDTEEDRSDNDEAENDGSIMSFNSLNPMHSSDETLTGSDSEPNSPHTTRAMKSRFSTRIMRPKTTLSEQKRKKALSWGRKIATFAAYAAWNLGDWGKVETFVPYTEPRHVEGQFLRAVVNVHNSKFDRALRHIRRAGDILGGVVPALVSESYNRAYSRLVKIQQFVELSEVVKYQRLRAMNRERADRYRSNMLRRWHQRIACLQRSVEVHQQILMVRSIVVRPDEDTDSWLNFAKVCRKRGRHRLCLKALMNLGVGKRKGAGRPKPFVAISEEEEEAEGEKGRRNGSSDVDDSDDATMLNKLAELVDESSADASASEYSVFSMRLANLDPVGGIRLGRKNSILPRRFSFRPGRGGAHAARQRSFIEQDNLSLSFLAYGTTRPSRSTQR